ncbi:antiterminator Q family protein [Pseudomonas sp. SbOxS1]|uniref:antiterminator Q family protein n=1 Tax=Pseudomonas sp. SbOxS1 TaxID=2723884 RepID=UPI0015D26BE3|nr:antiterminator Q family protein [Pseudomonas sp. SbOxS1]
MMIRKPAGRPLGDTEYLLEQWGWWRMDGMGVPGYTSPTLALMRQAVAQPALSKNYCITDDWAMAIDNAVAKLSIRDQQMGDVIWLYFGAKWPMARVGKYYGTSEGKTRELVRAGAAWIDCAVGSMRVAA